MSFDDEDDLSLGDLAAPALRVATPAEVTEQNMDAKFDRMESLFTSIKETTLPPAPADTDGGSPTGESQREEDAVDHLLMNDRLFDLLSRFDTHQPGLNELMLEACEPTFLYVRSRMPDPLKHGTRLYDDGDGGGGGDDRRRHAHQPSLACSFLRGRPDDRPDIDKEIMAGGFLPHFLPRNAPGATLRCLWRQVAYNTNDYTTARTCADALIHALCTTPFDGGRSDQPHPFDVFFPTWANLAVVLRRYGCAHISASNAFSLESGRVEPIAVSSASPDSDSSSGSGIVTISSNDDSDNDQGGGSSTKKKKSKKQGAQQVLVVPSQSPVVRRRPKRKRTQRGNALLNTPEPAASPLARTSNGHATPTDHNSSSSGAQPSNSRQYARHSAPPTRDFPSRPAFPYQHLALLLDIFAAAVRIGGQHFYTSDEIFDSIKLCMVMRLDEEQLGEPQLQQSIRRCLGVLVAFFDDEQWPAARDAIAVMPATLCACRAAGVAMLVQALPQNSARGVQVRATAAAHGVLTLGDNFERRHARASREEAAKRVHAIVATATTAAASNLTDDVETRRLVALVTAALADVNERYRRWTSELVREGPDPREEYDVLRTVVAVVQLLAVIVDCIDLWCVRHSNSGASTRTRRRLASDMAAAVARINGGMHDAGIHHLTRTHVKTFLVYMQGRFDIQIRAGGGLVTNTAISTPAQSVASTTKPATLPRSSSNSSMQLPIERFFQKKQP